VTVPFYSERQRLDRVSSEGAGCGSHIRLAEAASTRLTFQPIAHRHFQFSNAPEVDPLTVSASGKYLLAFPKTSCLFADYSCQTTKLAVDGCLSITANECTEQKSDEIQFLMLRIFINQSFQGLLEDMRLINWSNFLPSNRKSNHEDFATVQRQLSHRLFQDNFRKVYVSHRFTVGLLICKFTAERPAR
jgi:hypothetical protein